MIRKSKVGYPSTASQALSMAAKAAKLDRKLTPDRRDRRFSSNSKAPGRAFVGAAVVTEAATVGVAALAGGSLLAAAGWGFLIAIIVGCLSAIIASLVTDVLIPDRIQHQGALADTLHSYTPRWAFDVHKLSELLDRYDHDSILPADLPATARQLLELAPAAGEYILWYDQAPDSVRDDHAEQYEDAVETITQLRKVRAKAEGIVSSYTDEQMRSAARRDAIAATYAAEASEPPTPFIGASVGSEALELLTQFEQSLAEQPKPV